MKQHGQHKINWSTLTWWSAYLCLGLLVFLAFFDPRVLNPTNIGWLLHGDLGQHYLGWQAFRYGEGGGPFLGHTTLLAYPVGTPIFATDSNPFISLLLRPLSGLLPPNFQFIGPWYLLCLYLNLAFASALFNRMGFKRFPSLFLGALLAFQPILFARYGHDTLMSHWLILGAFLVCISVRSFVRASIFYGVLLFTSIAIHPYMFVMVNFIFGADLLIRAWREWGIRFGTLERVLITFVLVELPALWFGMKLGIFSLTNKYGNEIGVYSSDLLSVLNPFGTSRIMPNLPFNDGQYEGFAYIGLAGILLLIWTGIKLVRFEFKIPNWQKLIPLVLAGIGGLCLAVFPNVTLLGQEVLVFHIDKENPVYSVLESLRSSGRFIWIWVYILIFAMLLSLPRTAPRAMSLVAFALLLVQFWDIEPLRQRALAATAHQPTEINEFQTPNWQDRITRADYIYVPQELGSHFTLKPGAAAFHHGTPVTWFYTAQALALPEQHEQKEQLRLRVLNGDHDDDALLLLDQSFHLPLVHRYSKQMLTTHSFGEFDVVANRAFVGGAVMSNETHSIADLLSLCKKDCTAMMIAHGSAFDKLSNDTKVFLRRLGSQIDQYKNGDGLALIMRNGRIVEESRGEGADTSLNAKIGDQEISISSSVENSSVVSTLVLNGVDLSRNQPGLNILLAMDDGTLISASYQTHITSDQPIKNFVNARSRPGPVL